MQVEAHLQTSTRTFKISKVLVLHACVLLPPFSCHLVFVGNVTRIYHSLAKVQLHDACLQACEGRVCCVTREYMQNNTFTIVCVLNPHSELRFIYVLIAHVSSILLPLWFQLGFSALAFPFDFFFKFQVDFPEELGSGLSCLGPQGPQGLVGQAWAPPSTWRRCWAAPIPPPRWRPRWRAARFGRADLRRSGPWAGEVGRWGGGEAGALTRGHSRGGGGFRG